MALRFKVLDGRLGEQGTVQLFEYDQFDFLLLGQNRLDVDGDSVALFQPRTRLRKAGEVGGQFDEKTIVLLAAYNAGCLLYTSIGGCERVSIAASLVRYKCKKWV